MQTVFLSIDSSQIRYSQGQQVQVQQVRQGTAAGQSGQHKEIHHQAPYQREVCSQHCTVCCT